MNREIKFRAWCGAEYAYSSDYNSLWEFFQDCRDCKIEQYTGLKDKNGKEIYEGDILYANEWGYDCKTGKKIVVQVCFGRLGFEFIPKKTEVEYGWGNYVYHPCEIIGNIYENPELT